MATDSRETAKLLLVDDRPENLLALREVLARPDYEILQATSGEQALKQVLHHEFAVILMDVLMPGMDGFETAWLIRRREASRYIPIIFLTATDLAGIYRAYAVGAVDYLVKPVDPDVVRSKVEVFVELFRRERRIRQQEEELRLQRDLALRDSEHLYEATFREAPIGIGQCSPEGRWLRVNQKLCELIGRPAAELLQRRLDDDLVAENGRPSALSLPPLGPTTGGHPRHREVLTLRQDGQASRVDLAISAIQNGTGAPAYFTVVAEDVTERWFSEQRQRLLAMASERLLSSFDFRLTLREVAELAVGTVAEVCLLDFGERVVRATASPSIDPAALDALHAQVMLEAPGSVSESLHAGRPVLFPDTSRPLAPSEIGDSGLLGAVRQLGGSSVLVVPVSARERTIGTLVLVSPTKHYYGHADLRMAVDLAHRVAFAVENARLYQESEAAVGMRDEFLSIASHELRTPLTPLQLGLQMLLRKQGKESLEHLPAKRLRDLLTRSERQVLRLSQLLDNLLDVSRISAGRLELHREAVDLADLTRDVVGRLTAEAQRGSVSIVAERTLVGFWDRLRLEQVLMNLVSNALKYGDGKPITVSAERAGAWARIQVRDEGIGIQPERIGRIFERYERAVSPRTFGGLGLGLYIANQIVVAHRGKISVTSQLGAGSVFTVEIPLRSSPASEVGSQSQSTSDGNARVSL